MTDPEVPAPAPSLPEPVPAAPVAPAKRRRASPRQAVEVFRAGASGVLKREEVESVVARTRRGMRAAAPIAAEALLEIAADRKVSPGTRVKAATFMLTGSGVTQPGVPVTEEERRKIDLEVEALEKADADDLRRRVLWAAGLCGPSGPRDPE